MSFEETASLTGRSTSSFIKREAVCLSLCNKASYQSGSLRTHKLFHRGEKEFVCIQCDNIFSQSYILKRHNIFHTGDKHYSYIHCNYVVSQSGHLNRHKLSHTGEKEFACNQWSKIISRFSYLTEHELFHTGTKRFKCIQCDNGFLKKHKLSNTEKKQVAFTQWDTVFSQSGNLKTHKLSQDAPLMNFTFANGANLLLSYSMLNANKTQIFLFSFFKISRYFYFIDSVTIWGSTHIVRDSQDLKKKTGELIWILKMTYRLPFFQRWLGKYVTAFANENIINQTKQPSTKSLDKVIIQ